MLCCPAVRPALPYYPTPKHSRRMSDYHAHSRLLTYNGFARRGMDAETCGEVPAHLLEPSFLVTATVAAEQVSV